MFVTSSYTIFSNLKSPWHANLLILIKQEITSPKIFGIKLKDPLSITLNKSIQLSTYDTSVTPNVFVDENYNVIINGLISTLKTRVYVLPFKSTNYALKFTFPTTITTGAAGKIGPNDVGGIIPVTSTPKTIYITYCVKNTSYADGYEDYTTTVPQAFIDAFDSWINDISTTRYITATFKGTGQSGSQDGTGSFNIKNISTQTPTGDVGSVGTSGSV